MEEFLNDDDLLAAVEEICYIPSGSEDGLDFSDDDDADEWTSVAKEINSTSPTTGNDLPFPPILKPSTSKATDNVDLQPGPSQPTRTAQQPLVFEPPTKYRNIIWKHANFERSEESIKFTGNTDLPETVLNLDTPLQFFNLFFNDDIIAHICRESHRYSVQQNPNKPQAVSSNELKKYLGICVLMSAIHLPNARYYWNEVIGNRTIVETMSVKNFEGLRKILHFNDNNMESMDRLHKIRPIIDHLNKQFCSVPLEESLAVDEQICATKCRHYLKQYNPNKPHKWGYKLFILCGVSGFAYQFEVYSGLENDQLLRAQYGEPDLGASSNVVMRLARVIPKKFHHKLFYDNYYTSLPLLVELEKRNIHSLGTFRRNRFPGLKLSKEADIKNKGRGYSEQNVSTIQDVDVTAVIWKDNKTVSLASTFVGETPKQKAKRYDRKSRTVVEVECPQIVTVYNRHMGGVDTLDSLIGRYKNIMRSRKWYFRIFYHLIDLSIVNAWLLHKRSCKEKGISSMKLAAFRIQLGLALCKQGESVTPNRGRPRNDVEGEILAKRRRGPTQPAPPKDVRIDQISHWPEFVDNRQRCKMPGCQLKTFSKCTKCQVFLCLRKEKNCFTTYHNN